MYSTFDQVGYYSVAYSISGLLLLVMGALGMAWGPHATRTYEENPAEASAFFGRVMTYVLVGLGLIGVCLATFSKEVLMVVSAPQYYPAALAIGPLVLGYIAYGTSQVTASGIGLRNQTKYFAIVSWAAAIINLVLNLILIPKYGMLAACWTTFISYLFLTLSYYFISQHLWSILYEKRRVISVIILIFIYIIAVPLIPDLSFFFNILLKSLYCLSFIGMLLIFGALDNREWIFFIQQLTSKNIFRK
jgi:O-antigen/teichoic acid export membrane protein